ncbi:threonine aldolase family protein [Micropruina sonneratiae]|uniref:threonine aldolase family protein n=1 Tax=Micropruina sonneratiae TaxID=2986940 RepID=UPI0022266A81|nr:low specificity L-threonine aldolase [Micropruina sp. KQZ13P-5]MCW3159103.1 low specificity L-threonine aldolase [Micropruina sp. KQZ13P-5]
MQLHDPARRGFASDNYSGVHPEVLDALADANGGHQSSYGNDAYTARLAEVVRGHFGEQAETFPVFNGTGANVTGLLSVLPRWGGVVCAKSAHINVDEGGAPEKVAGLKLYPVDTPDGKLTPELLDEQAWGFGDEHRAQPLAVSITQSTELGTLYTPDEIAALTEHAHALGLAVHVDGARLSNAAAALGVGFAAFTTDAGVDLVTLGGTKNGAMGAEAIVVLDPERCHGLTFLRKTHMQLASKMRFVSAQLVALYEGDLWLRSASHANAMAARLRAAVENVDGVEFAYPTQANGVFARLPAGVADVVRQRFFFYDWDAAAREVRWMCSFDTTEADVDAFAALIRQACARAVQG